LSTRRSTERFVLLYSPVWMAAVGVLQLTRAFSGWGDLPHLALGVGLALPLWIQPLVDDRAQPVGARHATRFALAVAIFTFLQSYFGTQLFFHRLGMEYHFPVTWIWAGTPVFLYFLTIAYFSTYFVALALAWRTFTTRYPAAPVLVRLSVRALLAFVVAFAETAAMATDALRPYFFYRDRAFMLTWGAAVYGTVFFIGMPVFERIDDEPRTLRRVAWDALAANMVILVCYEAFSFVIRPR
jgi:cycloeucalenol cycloisomerase